MLAQIKEKVQSEDFLRVLCVGDLQTEQQYTSPKWSDWLQLSLRNNGDETKTWRRQVQNAGISKATPKHVSTYFSEYIERNDPDVIILSFGVASVFPTYREADFIESFEILLQKIQAKNYNCVMWSPYPLAGGVKKDSLLSITNIIEDKAGALNMPYVDIFHEVENLSLGQLYTYSASKNDEFFGINAGSVDGVNSNSIISYIIAKAFSEKIFGVPLVEGLAGDFSSPNTSMLKSW